MTCVVLIQDSLSSSVDELILPRFMIAPLSVSLFLDIEKAALQLGRVDAGRMVHSSWVIHSLSSLYSTCSID